MGIITTPVIDRLQMKIEAAPNPRQFIASGSGQRNFDYPMPYHGKMIKQALWNMEHDARSLREKLNDGDHLPQWVHYKIATAADRVNAVNNYMQYDLSENGSKTVGRTNGSAKRNSAGVFQYLMKSPEMQEPSIGRGRFVTFVGFSTLAAGLILLKRSVK